VFLAADVEYPAKLAAAGAAVEAPFVYAAGRLVLWVPRDSPLAIEREGLRALVSPRARRIAIANPRLAPYGAAAVDALRAAAVYDAVRPRLVFGENVGQAAHFARSGAADAGFVALALARAEPLRSAGRIFEVPPETHARLDQAGLLLARSRRQELARAFRGFLLGPGGRKILERFGYLLP
jgi:molybdate transport system substrate-binding protein